MAGPIGGTIILFWMLLGMICLSILTGALFSFAFWIMMLIDVAERRFKKKGDKVLWVIIIIFLGMFGAIIYYFAVKNAYQMKSRHPKKTIKKKRSQN